MKIKKLEIRGFKSFVDKASFHFASGITGIIGPNGCGKSNIVDAIKWVLGEQGVKTLRGKTMEDVIFNGTEKRRPVGMAEVTLTLSNIEDGSAPREYAEFSEISVKRRLYRSGEAEYYINNTPCRLRDIMELFMDTGIGSKAYSIVEQGHIDWLINSKPEERRLLIEEAAGIHKYKVRKDMALKKLESTRQNLMRVQDIIQEVMRQIRSIKRQAKKAEIYRDLREEVKGIEISLMGEELRLLKNRMEKLNKEQKNYRDLEITSSASLRKKEEKVETQRLFLVDKEKEIQNLEKEFHKKEERIRDREKEIDITELKVSGCQADIERMKREIKELFLKDKTLVERYNALKKEEDILQGKLKSIGDEVEGSDKRLGLLLSHLEPVYKEIEDKKKSLFNLLSMLTHIKNSLSNSEIEKARLLKVLNRIEDERREIEAILEVKKRRIIKLIKDIDSENKLKDGLKKEYEELCIRIKEMEDKKVIEERELEFIKERLTTVSTKLITLKESKETGEDIVNILSRKEGDGEVVRGVHGLVADIFRTDHEFERPLEAVLGERLQGIIVESHKEGLEALHYLKGEKAGRCSFIPIELRNKKRISTSKRRSDDIDHHKSEASIGDLLLNKVKVKEGYSSIARYLLEDVIVVKDLKKALSLWKANGIEKTIVTLEGDMIDPDGIITGGNTNGFDSSLLKKRRLMDELEREMRALKEDEKDIRKGISEKDKRLDNLFEKRESLKEGIHKLDLSIVSLKGEHKALEEEVASLRRRLEVLTLEEDQAKEDLNSIREEIKRLISEREMVELKVREEEDCIRDREEKVRIHAIERERIEKELIEKRVLLASFEGKLDSLKMGLQGIQRDRRDIEKGIKERRDRIEIEKEKMKGLVQLLDSWKRELIDGMEIIERLRKERDLVEEEYLKHKEEIKAIEGAIREERQEYLALQGRLNGTSLDLKEVSLKIEHLIERARDKYGIDEKVLINSSHPASDIDPCTRLETLNKRLSAMGEVNLSAIEELKELEERYAFLTSQQDDLNRSIESLQRAIQRINRVSRERFVKTLKEVNREFQIIYTRFFDGGRAEIRMLEEGNPLESGIDIVAQPKGKRLQNINLLSGGEKALTVLALIFSLLMVKPSPFFLLDEADAPLDDANSLRFINLVRELSLKSQFIIITHNKNTMEMADTLYGITMAESGVSSILSVNLKEVE